MFNKVDYVMVNVSDMARSIEFYRDVLGLPLRFDSPGWTEFDTGSTTLALHVAGSADGGHAGKSGKVAGTCAIGFSVDNLAATCEELKSRGARFVMEPTEQPNEGIRLAVCLDPDGLAVSFAEPIGREATGAE